jgi:hypothetical protein
VLAAMREVKRKAAKIFDHFFMRKRKRKMFEHGTKGW